MHESAELALQMLLIFGGAKLLAELFEAMRLPGIAGEMLAGAILGPSVLGWISPNTTLTALADLGVMFLLFKVGLEVSLADLMKVGRTALFVAVLGVIAPLLLGWGIMRLWGQTNIEAIFVAAAMVATSAGITVPVLERLGVLKSTAAQIILAAAVIDDVLGLLVLALVSSMARGTINYLQLTATAAVAIGFTLLVALLGSATMKRIIPKVHRRLSASEAPFHFSLVTLFALAVAAVYTGVAAIVGAFLAGMALSDTVSRRVQTLTAGVAEFLVPFFLAGIGLHLDLSAMRSMPVFWLAMAITAAAIASKLFGCGLGALSEGRRIALQVGCGMVPRGEVGMVVAQIGLAMGIVSSTIYGVTVFMAITTTLVAPLLSGWAFRPVRTEPRP
jgi:Kef-type K+ transport system membrane component KefB